jgi:DNA polymerase-3 subunit gamma/tau
LDDIYDHGHDMKKLYADLLEHFRNLLVAAMGKKVNKLIDLPAGEVDQLVAQAKTISTTELSQIFDLFFKAEASIRLSAQPKTALEMTLVRMLQSKPALPIDVLIDKLDVLRKEMIGDGQPQQFSGTPPSSTSNAKNLSSGPQGETSLGSPPIGARKSGIETEEAFVSNRPAEAWKQISKVISNKNPSLAVNLAKCKLKKIEDHRLEIEVPGNGITLKMIQREKNMAALRQVCADVLGSQKDIQLTPGTGPDESYQKKKSHDNELKKKALSHPLVADAVEIFDGKLVDVKLL